MVVFTLKPEYSGFIVFIGIIAPFRANITEKHEYWGNTGNNRSISS